MSPRLTLLLTIKNLTQENLPEKKEKKALVSNIEHTGKVNHYSLTLILKVLNISLPDFEAFYDKEVLKSNTIRYAQNEELNIFKA